MWQSQLPRGAYVEMDAVVALPATYSHIWVPLVAPLAREPEVRDWINAYVPGDQRETSSLPGDAALHVLWAADVWYSIKRQWCLEAQRLVRAQRAPQLAPRPVESTMQ